MGFCPVQGIVRCSCPRRRQRYGGGLSFLVGDDARRGLLLTAAPWFCSFIYRFHTGVPAPKLRERSAAPIGFAAFFFAFCWFLRVSTTKWHSIKVRGHQ